MKHRNSNVLTILSILVVFGLLLPGLAAAAGNGGEPTRVAELDNGRTALIFHPMVEYKALMLTVTGPAEFVFERTVSKGEQVFELNEETIDGCYTYELRVIPHIDPAIIDVLKESRQTGDKSMVRQLLRDGKLPSEALTQSGGFNVVNGVIELDEGAIEKNLADGDLPRKSEILGDFADGAELAIPPVGPAVPLKDFVINDDLIVDGSACIGFDCVNGESFGFDTIRLKENNLRIKFDDTSVAASFPRNDWQITINDSANGGASKFSVDDISGSRTPFTIEANARSHALYVDDGGRIGSRTSTPSVEIHTIDGDTPTLRLQQDGSSGFAPQTWDVAGNETNFFIRDVTNGSTLPFRIRPGASTSSLFIDTDDSIGVGTASPDASLHVLRSNASAQIFVEETSATVAARSLLKLSNSGNTRIELNDTNNGSTWFFSNNNGAMNMSLSGTGGPEVSVDGSGNMTISGTLTENSNVHAKENFDTIDPRRVLEQVTALPISVWNYKADDPSVRHMGPMAQDFFATFGLGGTDKGIAPRNLSAVALAAIQGLHQELEAKDAQVETLVEQNTALQERLEALEKIVSNLAGGQ